MGSRYVFLVIAAVLLTAQLALANDWLAESRSAAKQGDLQTALVIVEQRLDAAPNDWDALGWHARILSWLKRWDIAEHEYCRVLEHTPHDPDILLGLADVLFFQEKNAAALESLQAAEANGAPEEDVLRRKSRVLSALGRASEARAAYKRLVEIAPADRKVVASPTSMSDARRFWLRFGNESDVFSFTGPAHQQFISLRADWTARWTTVIVGTFDERFGADARRVEALATYKAGKHDWVTVGAQRANEQPVVPVYGDSLAYGHAFQLAGHYLKGVEASIEQRSLWFATSRVDLFRAGVATYLPKGWLLTFEGGSVKSTFGTSGSEWTPSLSSRVSWPLNSTLEANALFSFGSESYATIDQIGHFSARTWGGGLKVRTTALQDVSLFSAYQSRSQARSQTIVGISYGIRF